MENFMKKNAFLEILAKEVIFAICLMISSLAFSLVTYFLKI